MNNNKITKEDIYRWQIKAKLNCSIPKTRGVDAQILYDIGIRDLKDLAKYKPEKLLEKTNQSFDQLKIWGKKESYGPTLEEITNWIEWAKYNNEK
ncbi:MAG: DUF4332 domain-containing protein [Promethearchaeota archaeon]